VPEGGETQVEKPIDEEEAEVVEESEEDVIEPEGAGNIKEAKV